MVKDDGTREDAPRTPKKEPVTGEELEVRFDRWAAERRRALAERTPEQNGTLGRRTVVAALGLVLLGTAVYSGLSSEAAAHSASSNEETIASLRNQLDAAQGEAEDDKPLSATQLQDLVDDAAARAKEAADAQNGFAALLVKAEASADDSAGNGAPTKQMTAYVEHRKELAGLFEKSDLIVEDEKAYMFTTIPDFEDDQIDPRYPWYEMYQEDGTPAGPKEYSWSVKAVTPDLEDGEASDGDGHTASVTWTCEDTEGRVLAWATAQYSDASTKLSDLSVSVSQRGAAHDRDKG